MLLEGGKLEGASWRAAPADSDAGDAGSGGAGGCLVVGDGAELPLIQGVPADDRHLQLPEVPTSQRIREKKRPFLTLPLVVLIM